MPAFDQWTNFFIAEASAAAALTGLIFVALSFNFDSILTNATFLRGLDAAGAVRPGRSAGGHRRYSRRQLELATRIRELFDQGHNLAATLRIVALQDELADAHALIGRLRGQPGTAGPGGPVAR
jgi:hypothetical protein